MDRRVGASTGASSTAGMTGEIDPPLVGRRDVLDGFTTLLDDAADGTFSFVGLAGDPGAGKTRLLEELAAEAARRRLPVLSGRATEFEEMPFGAVLDALDDRLETVAKELPERLGAPAAGLLATIFPALSVTATGDADAFASATGRYHLYRAVRRLLEELAAPEGLVLILDDVHWADEATVELLDHLARHPPPGRLLVAVAYRPAQSSPRLAALMEIATRIPVDPLSEAEVGELLGPQVNHARRRALYEASGGNPFYLDALARMETGAGTPDGTGEPAGIGELPPAVRAALGMELSGLSATALLVARAAAVAGDEFEPAFAAVTAETSEELTLQAINELVARDVVRPSAPGRFRFRHPLVRHAAYESAAAGWRHAVHARIAARLADLRAPARVRAPHVERSARVGDQAAIATLVEAARSVAAQAPATAAHWLEEALRLGPDDPDMRLGLLLELARAQAVSGRLAEGKDTARELLRLLPPDDFPRRARAARLCGIMERQLDRPHEARALLLDELRRIPDTQAPAAVELRVRLVTESLRRSDFRAAQAVLDLMPESADGWEPSLVLAVAAVRPMPAYAAGLIDDAARYATVAADLMAVAPDDHLADWLDTHIWLGWLELMMGRYSDALQHFGRFLTVARNTGQSSLLPYMSAGQAQTLTMLGRLQEAAAAIEEAAEVARLLRSNESLGFAMTQQCLAATWSGDHESAVRLGEDLVGLSLGRREWWAAVARYARGMALIHAGRLDEGAEELIAACGDFDDPQLDPGTLMACCETLADVDATRERTQDAMAWADRADVLARPGLETNGGFAMLARAHALTASAPDVAAEQAQAAAAILDNGGMRIHAGRARLRAGIAYTAAGERAQARAELGAAAEIFAACGARTLHAQAVQAQRRVGVRVPGATGRAGGPHGLSRREFEVATLVAEGCTNQQIAERLFLSIRTVETHMSHIFAKLGVSSRVGIVSALNQNP
ncbi:helix-turn-helix transcriptional regulator [Actinoallomurus soli]|uniref:helix-turn-helix transcriptional regulator n=1 Tax=Actinoallomurus soli TaxID=2952535 RepID=UPI00209276C5|nr:AAA family ATPase [Actinoallomurus soli]MCO5966967.1 AAA family ATPase [Actinoallomurus soli]